MPMKLGERIRQAWNAFKSRDPTPYYGYGMGYSGYRPDRLQFTRGNERSIVTAIYNKIAVDVSMVRIEHVRVNPEGYYVETLKSGLNNALTLDANIDQTGPAFIQDAVMSMFDEGVVALVPVDTDVDPEQTGSYDILTMRTAKVMEWYPKHVRLNLYNERIGRKEDIVLPKSIVAIVENPFYATMNEQNSTLQRLIRILNDLDVLNRNNASGRLDILVHLPYAVTSDLKKKEAAKRKQEIEEQLLNSKYGIAYVGATENITQLNRPVENNLWAQAQDLTDQLFNQLGMTKSIFDGSATDAEKVNYYNNTISPILQAISKELARKFLTKTARTQGQTIRYFQNPFGVVPVTQIASMADTFTRNEILAPNEVRMELGYKPSADSKANELRNRNLNAKDGENPASINVDGIPEEGADASAEDVPDLSALMNT